jgi:MFS family permease
MKLLSIKKIFEGAMGVSRRFPLAMLACLAGTVIGIAMIHIDDPEPYVNLLLTLTFAAPMFVGVILFTEIKKFSKQHCWGLHGAVLAFLTGYYLLLPDPGVGVNELYVRHVMWVIGFVLIVTFVPFVYQRGAVAINRFWQYNRGLVFALVLTGIWAGALMAGISIALASIDFLFNITIDEERYMEIWFTLVGIFSPLFFLSRLPKKPHALDTKKPYPKEVRLFSQFVLVPLVTVYFLILYAYTARILLTSAWPEGQLAWMILGFSFLGVLTYLALYPLREKTAWVRNFGTGLFVAMIPQTGMLFWALSFRLRDYGFTENRYFVLVFGFWLLAIGIYYLVAKVKDIRVIPITVFIIAVVASVGPWGAFSVSERSQVDRLEGILVSNGLLQDGLYVRASVELTEEDEIQINEIVRYLTQNHGLDEIEPWFGGEDLDSIANERWERVEKVITEKFDIETRYNHVARYLEEGSESFALFVDASKMSITSIDGYEYMIDVGRDMSGVSEEFQIDDQAYELDVTDDGWGLELSKEGEVIALIDLTDLITRGQDFQRANVSREDASVTLETEKVKAMFIVESLFGELVDDTPELHTLFGRLLLTVK